MLFPALVTRQRSTRHLAGKRDSPSRVHNSMVDTTAPIVRWRLSSFRLVCDHTIIRLRIMPQHLGFLADPHGLGGVLDSKGKSEFLDPFYLGVFVCNLENLYSMIPF